MQELYVCIYFLIVLHHLLTFLEILTKCSRFVIIITSTKNLIQAIGDLPAFFLKSFVSLCNNKKYLKILTEDNLVISISGFSTLLPPKNSGKILPIISLASGLSSRILLVFLPDLLYT